MGVSDLFCPGQPLPPKLARIKPNTLYGCAAGSEWVTILLNRNGEYSWRLMRAGVVGGGSLGGLRTALEALGVHHP